MNECLSKCTPKRTNLLYFLNFFMESKMPSNPFSKRTLMSLYIRMKLWDVWAKVLYL